VTGNCVRILDVINKTTPYFEQRGVESPRLTIELLLAHLLKKKRLELYLEFERQLDEPQLGQLRELVKRRSAGEPLQYITGETEFCGLKFAVDRRVLIPRPETESLVETVVAGVRSQEPGVRIVDVGTGSGCIAVALAKQLPAAELMAVDSSDDALAVAQENAKRHGFEKRIRFFHSDLLTELPDSSKVDVVVSNPPYIAAGELAGLPKEVRDFEPVSALTAGIDGLDVVRRLVTDGRRVLKSSGFLAMEIGAGQCAAVENLLLDGGYAVPEVVKDLQGHERVIVARFQK
jgi:release factor glutamine methyltransferase